jgi:hypothetical protein
LRELAALQGSEGRVPSAQETPLFAQIPSTDVYDTLRLLASLACAGALATLTHVAHESADLSPPRAALLLIEPQDLAPRQRADDQPLFALFEAFRRSGGTVLTCSSRPHLIDSELLPASVFAAYPLTNVDAISASQHLLQFTDRETRRLSLLSPEESLWKRDGLTIHVQQTVEHAAIEAPKSGSVL